MTVDELTTDKVHCCGCGACVNICPHGALSMSPDTEGFLYPIINPEKCTNCELCCRLCEGLALSPCEQGKAFVAIALNDDLRYKSSSGGVFSLLALHTLRGGGAVYGAAFNEDFEVCHIAVDRIDDLHKLMGSKYVQSSLSDTFICAKQILEKGRHVLFSGVPCQIAALKGYLRKNYANLVTVDLICHGVPSPRVWKEYVSEMRRRAGAPIRRISFRAKNSSWKRYAVSFSFENDTAYLRPFTEDLYMKGFLSDLYLRPACYACRFKNNNRASDITLADCWGIERLMPEMDDDKGTSLVIINSTRGEELFNIINKELRFKEISFSIIPKYNGAICKSAPLHPKRSEFFEELQRLNGDITPLIRKFAKDTFLKKCKKLLRNILARMRLLNFALAVKNALKKHR